MKAYVWVTGVVEFGKDTPEGALEIAEGEGQEFIESIKAKCRRAYPAPIDGVRQPDIYFIPGVREAESGQEAIDVVTAFLKNQQLTT